MIVWLAVVVASVLGAGCGGLFATRRERARARLLGQRLERLEASLRCAKAATFRIDRVRRVAELSGESAELLGFDPSVREVRIEDWIARIHPDDRATVAAVNASYASGNAKGDQTHFVTYRVRMADEWRWVSTYVQRLPGGAGSQGVVFDASSIKQLETEQRAFEERLRSASVAAKFYTWEIDVAERVQIIDLLHVDDRLRAQRGFSARGASNGIMSVPLSEGTINAWSHPDDAEAARDCMRRQLDGVGPCYQELRTRSGDGGYHWIALHWTVLRDADGKPVRLLGITQDIDDRKRVELELRAAEARFARAVRGTNDGLWEMNLRDGELWWAPRVYQMLGYEGDCSRLDSSAVRKLVAPEDMQRLNALVQEHIEEGTPYDVELRLSTLSGERRWFRVRGAVERDAKFKPIWLSGCVQDITTNKNQEQALRDATAAAAAANRAKSAFLANMSHEIRTPMNGVIGMSNLLLETALDGEQAEYVQTIRNSSDALLMIINDILDFSKVEAGELRLEQLDMDLRDACEEAARLLAIQAHAKGIELTLHIDPRLPQLVRADAGRIRQVLLNLGGNAVKFTQRGEVAISLEVLESHEDNTMIRCTVRDTGIGIPADRLPCLFRPFTQVDASTTRRFGGTGLGLSIVHRLVQLMGGETGAASVLGEGSTFWFTARLAGVPTQVLSQLPAPPTVPPCRVLVVTPNEAHRAVLLAALQECGASAQATQTADATLEALEEALIAERPFNIALLDHRLSECEAAHLAARIQAQPQFHSLRMVLLMPAGQRGDRRRIVENGFAAYLMKPVFRRDLATCLRQVLSGEVPHRTEPVLKAPSDATTKTSRMRRILLAEDNLINQKVAQRLLERMGYRVDIVGDGRSAVDAWQAERFDMILMDCQMPEMDGYEATREIRRLENGARRIPIIALTAHAMKGADAECLAAGMDDYLTKPIDIAALRACLERYLATAPGVQSVA